MPDLLLPGFMQMRPCSIIYGKPGVQFTFSILMRHMLNVHSSASAVSSSIKAFHVLASYIHGTTS